jgi:hypothetical protein
VVHHVVVFSWTPEATPAQIDAFRDGLAALPAQIPEIRRYRFGPEAGLGQAPGDFDLAAEFDDVDAYRAYVDHPAHQALIADRLRPILAGRQAVQFIAG